jgi:BirA family transcriptional regulator, biotin operon repressor / biotin---[acetyl-CoA-carboxylase] ligase
MIFNVAQAHELLSGTRFERIRYLTETDSTNSDAQKLLGIPGSAGLVLLAEYQRAGKGRRSRSWIAPAGSSLLFTAILPEAIPTTALWALPFWIALVVAEGVEKTTGSRLALQWPNDLLLNERKCCGILAVSRIVGERAWVGCGVGLNARRPENNVGVRDIQPPAAFLSDDTANIKREELLASILHACNAHLRLLHDPVAGARAWETRAALPGSRYRIVMDSGETFEGEALRLDNDGSLIVQTHNQERRITSADARVLHGEPSPS